MKPETRRARIGKLPFEIYTPRTRATVAAREEIAIDEQEGVKPKLTDARLCPMCWAGINIDDHTIAVIVFGSTQDEADRRAERLARGYNSVRAKRRKAKR